MHDGNRKDLESKVAFLEHTVEALNEVVVGQARELEALADGLEQLERRLARALGKQEPEPDPLDERPPHY